MKVHVNIKKISEYAKLPQYMSEYAAGADIYAATEKDITLYPHKTEAVPCGFQMEIPVGYEAQIRPRSGLAAKHSISLANPPGTIDADYRGEVKVLMINHGIEPFVIKNGERIAQMIIAPVTQADFSWQQELSDTKRGAGGFGSTGN